MRRVRYFLACVALCIPVIADAQPVVTKTVKLSKVVFNPEIPAASQRVKVGTICLFSGSPYDFGPSARTAGYERFERLFSETMIERGFNVIVKSSNLFESEDSGPGPDFLIGATFRPQSVDVCDSVSGQKGTISISVEWQVYDRSKQKVVETLNTEGSGALLKFHPSGLETMFNQAFSASVGALIDLEVLQNYLGTPHAAEKSGEPDKEGVDPAADAAAQSM